MLYNRTSRFLKKLVTKPFSRQIRDPNSPVKTHALNMTNNFTFVPHSPHGSTWVSSDKHIKLPVWSSFKPVERILSSETLYSTLPGRTFRSLHIESQIGTPSVHGEAYKCKYNSRPVILKVIQLKDQSEISGFFNEVRIGTTKGIERVGTRTLAYGISQGVAYHVMTDVTYSQSYLTSVSLNEYMRRLNACPSTDHPLYKKLFKTLFQFYKLSKGYHGDLHGGNVYVVYRPKDINDVVSIKLIDYGAHTKFKNSSALESCKNISDIFRMIDANYMNNFAMSRYLNSTQPLRYQRGSVNVLGIPTIFSNNREAYRPNTQLIAKGVAFKNQPTSRAKYNKMSSAIRKLNH
jgi:hypothetical protein